MISKPIAVFLAKVAIQTGLLDRLKKLTYDEIKDLELGDVLIDGLGRDYLVVRRGEAVSGCRWYRIRRGRRSSEVRGPWDGGLVDSVTMKRRAGFEDGRVYVLKGSSPKKNQN